MNKTVFCCLLLAGLLTTAAVLNAQGVGEVAKDIGSKAADVVFTEIERHAIEKYYEATGRDLGRTEEPVHDYETGAASGGKGKKGKQHKGKSKGTPPGLAKKDGGLPPGIAKKLERGGELPPGLAKRGLPTELNRQLPPPRSGYERLEVDGEVLLVEAATGIIRDIIGRGGSRATRENVVTKPAGEAPVRKEVPVESAEKKASWKFW